ncbi:hypothetical protein PE066_19665 [Ramlibacter tataouinensis]|uniref:hypothetical protein n=1 Tax=Ramlibacter tataouinensis TaxID=94132 RepID=UPI0022F3F799|nr:hypothetical protein [Ramlibacter tataouinensis]WBY01644.1 hypothetical protein PE066_19665 [Ramlibacter tataouinensis]
MGEPLFHVVLEGRKLGPYDRRTVVGMRIKKALSSDHVLIDTTGQQLTVADLIGRPPASRDYGPSRTSGFSVVQATYAASLVAVQGRGLAIPAFRGEVEARVQSKVLRIAGRFRRGLDWKEDRVKLPLKDIVHAGASGSEVELGLWVDGRPPQRIRLELFTPGAATEFLQWLPDAAPWPAGGKPAPRAGLRGQLLWASMGGVAVVALVLAGLVLGRGFY